MIYDELGRGFIKVYLNISIKKSRQRELMNDTLNAYLVLGLPEKVAWLRYEIPWWAIYLFNQTHKN